MAVAVANAVLLTDGDAAFLRVDNRRPAHALEPGVAAAAINKRFDGGKPGPRYGVACDAWGLALRNMIPADAVYSPVGPIHRYTVTGLTAGVEYVYISGPDVQVLQVGAEATNPANGETFTWSGTGPIYVYATGIAPLPSPYLVHARILRAANTSAYKRFNDPVTDTDNAILITDDWRDAAGEDGGRGRAWRIQSGNGPQEISLNGHDVWGTARLIQCHNAMVLLRHGNERHYFISADVDTAADTIKLHAAPSWGSGTAKRIRFELVGPENILGASAPAGGNYYYCKYSLSGANHLIELYSDETLLNKMVFDSVDAGGRFYVELSVNPIPWFGNGAPVLILQAGINNSAFELGFVAIPASVAVTGTNNSTGMITAENHRLIPGDSVTLTLSTDVIAVKYAAPRSEHTFVIYDTQEQALADPGARVAITDTDQATDVLTAVAHGLTTGDAVTLGSGITGVTAATTYYARVASASTFSLYDTSAYAIAGGATGLVNLTTDDQPGVLFRNGQVGLTNNQTGSVKKSSAAGMSIPPCREGVYYKGRFIGIVGADIVVISDPFDFLHYTSFVGNVAANLGESGQANWLLPLGDDTLLIGKLLKILAITGLSGPVTGWKMEDVTGEYGGIAALAALNVGTDAWLFSRKGVASIVRTVAGERLGVARTVSHSIPKDLQDVDWHHADMACSEIWNNRYFIAVPLKGQGTDDDGNEVPVVNNAVLVHNFLNQTLTLEQTVLNGQIIGRVTEGSEALAATGQYSWEGTWTGETLTPYAFGKLTVNEEERLTFASPTGIVYWLHDGWDDNGAEISDELLTRGYFGSREVLALKGALQLETYNPSVTATIGSAGVNEESALEGFNPLTRDRTKYLMDGLPDYNPATSTEAQFDAPHREDYSPTAEEVTVSSPDWHQTITEPFRCRERDYGIQLRIANAQGSCRVCGTAIQGKPVGISATRKT